MNCPGCEKHSIDLGDKLVVGVPKVEQEFHVVSQDCSCECGARWRLIFTSVVQIEGKGGFSKVGY